MSETQVDVFININYSKIIDIDTINQRFFAEVVIESKWFDQNFNSLDSEVNEKRIWKPEIYVENGVKDIKEEIVYKIIPDKNNELAKMINKPVNDCLVSETRKVTGMFSETLELHHFPLDVQDLTIHVASKKSSMAVNFVVLQDECQTFKINNILDKSMWKMHCVLMTKKENIIREYSLCKTEFPGIKVSAKVFRLGNYFLWNAFLPFLLVSFASLAPFVNDIKNAEKRLPTTCTLILTAVGTRFTIGRLLPTISYLTSVDKYSLSTMLIITIELLYHAIFGTIFSKINPNIGYKVDFAFFCFFFLLLLTKEVYFIHWAFKVQAFRKRVHSGEVVKLNEEMSSVIRLYKKSLPNVAEIVRNISKSGKIIKAWNSTELSKNENEAEMQLKSSNNKHKPLTLVKR